MRILVSETPDKKTRSYIDVEPDMLLKIIESDYGFHEVICMFDPHVPVRLFFDVESTESPSAEVLSTTLAALNAYYKTTDADWAITDGTYGSTASFHIFSTKYCRPLCEIREDVKRIACPFIDDAVYSFSIYSTRDEGSLRLPNQSKQGINKEAGIHRLVQGELRDCLVTQVGTLIPFEC